MGIYKQDKTSEQMKAHMNWRKKKQINKQMTFKLTGVSKKKSTIDKFWYNIKQIFFLNVLEYRTIIIRKSLT